MNDEELKIENKSLYTNDAVWQEIIIDLSEQRVEEEETQKNYITPKWYTGNRLQDEENVLFIIRKVQSWFLFILKSRVNHYMKKLLNLFPLIIKKYPDMK
ncbi:hypothetical protein SAMN04488598_10773 [Halanaerobium congolense]|jgi:hypothetical protein|uniref:Uncharacterized protein n=1 Tax=Halanaerobium congolense TaxID=54121 RepID=A0A1H9ZTB8_9FIRM|nr:hypothetical protein [Halanaerobium congolense]RSD33296.1 MAG: type III restriction protein res subunit [Methanohalophilus sp.]PTX16396.1 hypothetical protein C7953_1113 [Halanaerobium congolense]SDF17814.1 hypothetical protein SAMN04488598_10773 [Halanaerobium congolense]SES84953.1 hypothetical protein SAMN04515652_10873 [Halanaerobium congolense]SFO94900.1 hypothetical protein SAMN04488596_10347 [Halanaerobium congolense]